jgi:hypothetical protein
VVRHILVLGAIIGVCVFAGTGLVAGALLPGEYVSIDQARKVTGGSDIAPMHLSKVNGNATTDVCTGEVYTECGGGSCGRTGVSDLYSTGTKGLTKPGYCSQKACNMGSATCGSPNYPDCT